MKRNVLELANHRVIALGEERMEILEQKNRRLDLIDDLIERHERIAW